MTAAIESSALPLVAVAQPELTPVLEPLRDHFRLVELDALSQDERRLARAIVVVGDQEFGQSQAKAFPNLQFVACFTVGCEGIDVDWLTAQGIAFRSDPGSNAEDVADLVIAAVLMFHRRILEGDTITRQGRWRPDRKLVSRSASELKIGIVGLGRIGTAVARRAEMMRMAVSWWGPRSKPKAEWPRAGKLLALATQSDALIVAAPSPAPGAPPLINQEVLEAIGSRGMVVNVGRGALVDEDAARECLKSGKLGFGYFDVFAEEPTPPSSWADVPNTLLTPHIAGVTTASLRKMRTCLCHDLEAFFSAN
ncbi:NAD(P)-dependent oxidoreductase [Hansschlegelia sp. KR7-227]|uniref:NAD(P)-dependent oxidoreductase n=1 Tax=Hansschlegelia sp. KR7-227 TaxID=3400914 RepID=UPI003C0F0D92